MIDLFRFILQVQCTCCSKRAHTSHLGEVMIDRTGQALGQYRIIASIGHGGFADVYLGEHVFLKTQAAIKVLHTRLASDMNEQFLAEARTIAHLVHPSIVRVHDFGIEDTTPFLVMDYAPNGTLRQHHPRGVALPLALIVPYVKQIAGALQFAHDRRLVHRDVKPENMLLGTRNEVLLSDFGIATISQTSRSLSTQDISGTIAYMAPEQVQGKARPASDQYSLGIIVYEWLMGRCPFQGSFAEIASQHMFAPLPSLRALNPSIPREVEEVLMTALSKNADSRFARIEAFAIAFEQASHTGPAVLDSSYPRPSDAPTYIPAFEHVARPITPPPAPFLTPVSQSQINTPPQGVPDTVAAMTPGVIGQPASQPSRKAAGVTRRNLLIGAGVAVALVGAGEGAWYLLARRSTGSPGNSASLVNHNTPTTGATATVTQQSQPDPTATPRPLPAPVTLLIHQGQSQEYTVAWSPDGRHIVSGGNSSTIEVWDALNNTSYFSMNVSPATRVLHVAWSHDGSKIASADSKGNIIIWDATNNGNRLNSIPAHPNHFANGVAWSPDDTRIASCGGYAAGVWDVQTGNSIASFTQHTNYVNAVAWSHNGTFIVSASDDGTAQVWYAGTGQPSISYTAHSGKVLAVAWSKDDTRIASGSADNTARVWDASSGSTYLVYSKHSNIVASLDWSPDGQKIVTGSQDLTAQVWNPDNGLWICTFSGHTYEVEGVAWAFDSRRVASASDDGTVQVWQIP